MLADVFSQPAPNVSGLKRKADGLKLYVKLLLGGGGRGGGSGGID